MIPPFVSESWLAQYGAGVVLADVRLYLDGRSTRVAYDAGHRPGAVYVDLSRWLSADPTPEAGRHPLPAPETFAEGMGLLGIGDETPVVAYDDAGGVIAARLVWLLRSLGHPAALLDAPWPPAELSRQEPAITPARFTSRPWPAELLASADDVAATRDALIDARQRERYAGEPDGIDPRSGHIPGAASLPTREHLAPDGTLLPAPELLARFAEAGIGVDTPFISYCGSGVTACHNLLVAEHAGLAHGRLYPGSWSQWASDPSRPIAAGPVAQPE